MWKEYHTVKTSANKDCRKFGRKNFSELKSIFNGNVMEIVKIDENLGAPPLFTVQ